MTPFNPQGNTVVISANATAPLGLQVYSPVYAARTESGQIRIFNASGNTVHLGVGSSAAEAQANAVASSSGVPAPGIPIAAGAVEVLRCVPGAYFSGYASTPSTVYITPGEGL